jgi:hypothetical protein
MYSLYFLPDPGQKEYTLELRKMQNNHKTTIRLVAIKEEYLVG